MVPPPLARSCIGLLFGAGAVLYRVALRVLNCSSGACVSLTVLFLSVPIYMSVYLHVSVSLSQCPISLCVMVSVYVYLLSVSALLYLSPFLASVCRSDTWGPQGLGEPQGATGALSPSFGASNRAGGLGLFLKDSR